MFLEPRGRQEDAKRSLDALWLVGFERLRPGARSIQPKFQPVRPGKVVHLKRWTRFLETSFSGWTEPIH